MHKQSALSRSSAQLAELDAKRKSQFKTLLIRKMLNMPRQDENYFYYTEVFNSRLMEDDRE